MTARRGRRNSRQRRSRANPKATRLWFFCFKYFLLIFVSHTHIPCPTVYTSYSNRYNNHTRDYSMVGNELFSPLDEIQFKTDSRVQGRLHFHVKRDKMKNDMFISRKKCKSSILFLTMFVLKYVSFVNRGCNEKSTKFRIQLTLLFWNIKIVLFFKPTLGNQYAMSLNIPSDEWIPYEVSACPYFFIYTQLCETMNLNKHNCYCGEIHFFQLFLF